MPQSMWELDDFTHRFATCALDLRRPFDTSSPPTHRIFIGDADHAAIFEACCGDIPKPIVKRHASPAQPAPQANPVPAASIAHPVTVDRHIRMPELEQLVGMKRSTIYKRIDEQRWKPDAGYHRCSPPVPSSTFVVLCGWTRRAHHRDRPIGATSTSSTETPRQ